jgi:hypothetical protein
MDEAAVKCNGVLGNDALGVGAGRWVSSKVIFVPQRV